MRVTGGAVHEAVGFCRLGVCERVGYKMEAWHDVGWWQLALQPHARAQPCFDVLLDQGEPRIRPTNVGATTGVGDARER